MHMICTESSTFFFSATYSSRYHLSLTYF